MTSELIPDHITAMGRAMWQQTHMSTRAKPEAGAQQVECLPTGTISEYVNKIVEMLGELSGRDIMTMEGVRAACRGLMHVVKYDRFQFARAYEYFQQCAGAKLEGQTRVLVIGAFDGEAGLQLNGAIKNADSYSYAAWNASIGAITGLSLRVPGAEDSEGEGEAMEEEGEAMEGAGAMQWGISVISQCTVPDAETLHYPLSVEAFPDQVQRRILVLAIMAICYDLCTEFKADGRKTLKPIIDDVLKELEAVWQLGKEGNGIGVCVMNAKNVRVNWVPFTPEEARYLAFGTQVSADALPAVAKAISILQGSHFVPQEPAFISFSPLADLAGPSSPASPDGPAA